MSGFDQIWFDELRTLNAAIVQRLPHQAFVPQLHEAHLAGALSTGFVQTAMELLRRLYQTRYPFGRDFCVYERHICVFPQGRAHRGQWNIGFYAGDSNDQEDFARIGVGFRLRRDICPEGIDDYTDFVQRVLASPQVFDTIFSTLGSYSEGVPSATATAIRTDNPEPDDDWRFFGTRVIDQSVLQNLGRVATKAVQVFDTIRNSGFF